MSITTLLFLAHTSLYPHTQVHVWVASFPAHAVMLVDAVVWTQSVSTALARTGMCVLCVVNDVWNASGLCHTMLNTVSCLVTHKRAHT